MSRRRYEFIGMDCARVSLDRHPIQFGRSTYQFHHGLQMREGFGRLESLTVAQDKERECRPSALEREFAKRSRNVLPRSGMPNTTRVLARLASRAGTNLVRRLVMKRVPQGMFTGAAYRGSKRPTIDIA